MSGILVYCKTKINLDLDLYFSTDSASYFHLFKNQLVFTSSSSSGMCVGDGDTKISKTEPL